MTRLKRRLPKKRWKRVCLYTASVLLILVASDMLLAASWRQIAISPETTNITSPLNPAGLPDYIAAINNEYGRGVTPQNNAMPLLLQITGTADLPESFRLHSLPLIGLPSDPKPPLILSYNRFANILVGPAEKPWTRNDNPDFAQFLASQQEVLQLALEASDRPRYFLPLPTNTTSDASGQSDLVSLFISGTLHRISAMVNISQILAMDAMRCVGENDPVGFHRDALALMKLARLVAQGPTLIEHLITLAIYARASRIIKIAATHPDFFTAPQAERLLHAMNSLPPMTSPAHAFNTIERWLALDRFCNMARSSNAFAPIHYNAVLRSFNHYYDQLVACYQLPTYQQQKNGLETLQSEIDRDKPSMLMSITNPAPLLFVVALPSMSKAATLDASAVANYQLSRVALALAAYKNQHARYPDSLSQLLSENLKEIPLDPFSNAPLIYRPTPTGYILYSFGPNEKDDGGAERDSNHPKNWDIVVRAGE